MEWICFYAALFLEVAATGGFLVFLFRQDRRVFRYAHGTLLAGFVFHTVFFAIRYISLGAAPVLDLRSALSFFSWSILLAYFVLQPRFKLMVLGSFVAPFAVFLMILSSTLPWVQEPIRPLFRSLWLTLHVGTVFMGNGLFAIAFLAGVMYLIQEHAIKNKKLGAFYGRLPSLPTLDQIHSQSLLAGFAFLTLGMLSGSVYAQMALGSYWRWDPKEVWSLITWFCYAVLLHERLAVGWKGRRSAIMSIICFAVLLFTFLGSSLLMGGYHSFKSLGGPLGS